MRINRIAWTATLTASLLLLVPLQAQQPQQSDPQPQRGTYGAQERTDQTQPKGTESREAGVRGGVKGSTLTSQDRNFLQEAYMGNRAEVEMAELAAKQASNNEVKQFAHKMVDHHTKANQELERLAQAKNVTFPQQLESKHRNEIQKLSKMSGQQFDQAFMRERLNAHHKNIQLYEKAAQSARDNDVRDYASDTLSTLREHYQEARTVAQNAGIDISEHTRQHPETGTQPRPGAGTGTQPRTGTGTQPQTGTRTQPQTDPDPKR
jgi:putative membrane protein